MNKTIRIDRERLLSLREARRLSQEEVAARVGIDPKTLRRFEKEDQRLDTDGRSKLPILRTLSLLAQFYDVDEVDLQTIIDTPSPESFSSPTRAQQLQLALGLLSGGRRPLFVAAPRRYGKKTFVRSLLDRWNPAELEPPTSIQCDTRRIHQDSNGSMSGFLRQFCEHLDGSIPSEIRGVTHCSIVPTSSSRDAVTETLYNLLRATCGMVVLTIERIDALYDHDQHEAVLMLVRSWAENRRDPTWARLRLILTTEIPPILLEQPSRSSLLEQAEVIHLGPLTIHEQQQFVSENHVAASEHALQHLASKIGGHPLLWSRLISRAQALDCSLDQLGVPFDLFEQDLMRLQREVHHHGLFPAVQRLCSNPAATLSEQEYARLYRLGVVGVSRLGRFHFATPLFERHLRDVSKCSALTQE